MDVTPRSLLLLLHVLSAFWLAASAFGGTVVRAAGRRAPDLASRVAALRIGQRMATVFGIPGGVLAGATGIWIVVRSPDWLKFGWVHVSLTLWAVIFGMNAFYLGPRLGKLLAAGEASLAAGAPTAEFQRLAASKLAARLADVNALAIVIFVALMVLKPS